MKNTVRRAAFDSSQVNEPCSTDIGLRAEIAAQGNEVEVGLEPIVARAGGLAEGFPVVGCKLSGLPINDSVSGAIGCDCVDESLQEGLTEMTEHIGRGGSDVLVTLPKRVTRKVFFEIGGIRHGGKIPRL